MPTLSTIPSYYSILSISQHKPVCTKTLSPSPCLSCELRIIERKMESIAVFPEAIGISTQIGLLWQQVRQPLVVPFFRIMVFLCLAMSLMLFVEKVYMGIVMCFIKIFNRKPEKKYKWEPMKKDDLEIGDLAYPMVLVQIPMYNEKEVI